MLRLPTKNHQGPVCNKAIHAINNINNINDINNINTINAINIRGGDSEQMNDSVIETTSNTEMDPLEQGTFLGSTKARSNQIGKQLGLKHLKSSIESLKLQTSDFHQRIVQNHLDFDFTKLKESMRSTESLSTMLAPLINLSTNYFCGEDIPMSNLAVFTMTLLGSSLGFFSFLYFISLGYGMGVALPAIFALSSFNQLSKDPIPALTNLHTINVIVWGIRLSLFLLHREFINWKEWHDKLKEVDQRSKLSSKFSIWMSCTFFYASLVMPCLYRMRQASSAKSTPPPDIHTNTIIYKWLPDKFKSPYWGTIGILGITLQIVGILVESIADFQKATFKAKKIKVVTPASNSKSATTTKVTITFPNRNKWCNVGLWNYFTHPNYYGEVLFWAGTFVAGLGAMETTVQYMVGVFGMVGIFVIIFGAIDQLDQKNLLQYKKNPEFVKYREHIGFMGPKFVKQWKQASKSKGKTVKTAKKGNRSR